MDEIKKRLESELSHTVSRIRRMAAEWSSRSSPARGRTRPWPMKWI
jgi:hypothetical protein